MCFCLSVSVSFSVSLILSVCPSVHVSMSQRQALAIGVTSCLFPCVYCEPVEDSLLDKVDFRSVNFAIGMDECVNPLLGQSPYDISMQGKAFHWVHFVLYAIRCSRFTLFFLSLSLCLW